MKMITPEGDYLSNLTCPDLRPHFKHLTWRTMPHSCGHMVASDWADKADDDPVFGIHKQSGFFTRDETAILYNVASSAKRYGSWLDIGAATGWSSRHIYEGSSGPLCIEPMLRNPEFHKRFEDNTEWTCAPYAATSELFFSSRIQTRKYDGVCIDGDHDIGKPLEDAQNAAKHLADDGVIVFHDFVGQPVREAVTWLMDHGFKARVYNTPYMVTVCWRGNFTPPEHVPDERVDWQAIRAGFQDFDFRRTV